MNLDYARAIVSPGIEYNGYLVTRGLNSYMVEKPDDTYTVTLSRYELILDGAKTALAARITARGTRVLLVMPEQSFVIHMAERTKLIKLLDLGLAVDYSKFKLAGQEIQIDSRSDFNVLIAQLRKAHDEAITNKIEKQLSSLNRLSKNLCEGRLVLKTGSEGNILSTIV